MMRNLLPTLRALLTLGALLITACSRESLDPSVNHDTTGPLKQDTSRIGPVIKLVIIPATAEITVDDVIGVNAVFSDASGDTIRVSRAVEWTSDDPDVAAIAADPACDACTTRQVHAIAEGSARIIVTSGHVADTAVITVKARASHVPGTLRFKSISAGAFDEWPEDVNRPIGSHTCGVTLEGDVYCWGRNDRGQLGYYPPSNQWMYSQPSPALVSRGVQFASVSAGTGSTCALEMAGAVLCWGEEGTGITDAFRDEHFASVEHHFGHYTCALTPSGNAKCLNAGETFVTDMSFVALSVGSYFACGVTAAHDVYCWEGAAFPTIVGGGHKFVSVAAGYAHACALTDDGAAWCWGNNTSGALGDGSTINRAEPVQVKGGLQFAQLSAGHSAPATCGVTVGGDAYCWGTNDFGQVGDGSRTAHAVPARVAGGFHFAAVSAGGTHTCGVTTANVAYCWGDNEFGALGVPGENSSVPAKVQGQP